MKPLDLDVRPILRAGGEPFGAIMSAVRELAPGQSLRLIAPFRPDPLFQVLARQGLANDARQVDGGDWEILFSPVRTEQDAEMPVDPAVPVTWPEPIKHIDCSGLEPPEPMVRVLAALETLVPGQVLFALLAREPLFLFPELTARGHAWYGQFDETGKNYRLLILAGSTDD
jgi:TusA-related sulfurtransferase